MKSSQSYHWMAFVRVPTPRLEAVGNVLSVAARESAQQERITTSKLDRLANELRALGIDF